MPKICFPWSLQQAQIPEAKTDTWNELVYGNTKHALSKHFSRMSVYLFVFPTSPEDVR